jgi:hypothetical protein
MGRRGREDHALDKRRKGKGTKKGKTEEGKKREEEYRGGEK